MGSLRHRALSVLCAVTLATSMVPTQAFAETLTGGGALNDAPDLIPLTSEADAETSAEALSLLIQPFSLDSVGPVPLKSSNEVRWIDRLDLSGYEATLDFYNALIEAADNDGENDFLIENAYFDGTAASGSSTSGVGRYDKVNGCIVAFEGSYTGQEDFNNKFAQAMPYLYAAVAAFDRDHPEVFWLSGKCQFTSWGSGGKYSIGYVLNESTLASAYANEDAIKQGIQDREANIDEILGAVEEVSGASGKTKGFNKWLTEHNAYNTNLKNAQSNYKNAWECVSALSGKAGLEGPVCEGYARAFKVLCDRSGIPCVLVDGDAKTSPTSAGEGHMWNYVQIENGKWYAVDVTWNDPNPSDKVLSGLENEDWFLVGSDTMIEGMAFLDSHPVTNKLFNDSKLSTGTVVYQAAFANGPTLSSARYESVAAANCAAGKHQFFDYIYNNDATCAADGTETAECLYCMATDCRTAAGTKNDQHTSGAVEKVPVQLPTCTNAGIETQTVRCTVCQELVSSTEVKIPALGHDWGAWMQAKAATCVEDGSEKRVCAHDPSHVETRSVAALGHDVESLTSNGDATCTEDGTKSGICERCQQEVDKVADPGSALGHNWSAWSVVKAATCTAAGTEQQVCSVCGEVNTRAIAATGHTMGSWTTVRAATCTAPGAEQRRCTHAGCAYSETRATAATGHAFGAYRPNGDAKVGVNGTETATCSKCGSKTTRTAAGSALAPAVGQTVSAGGSSYTATGAATVTYAGSSNKKAASVTVPATVAISGRTYKVTAIASKAFAGNKYLKSVKIGANVAAIPASAFKGCTKLTSVSFGSGITSLGKNAFYGCKALKSVTLGTKVATIGDGAFQNCTKLTKVTVKSKSLKSVGKSAFAGCKALKSVALSSTALSSIGASAFSGCAKLSAVTLKTTKLKSVGKNALKGTAKKLTVKVPKAKVKAYQKLFKSKGSKTVTVKK